MSKKRWQHQNPEKYRTYQRELMREYRKDPAFRMREAEQWKARKMGNNGKISLLPRQGGNIDVMKGNTRIGFVESDMLYGIDGKGYASEIETISHRVEIIAKLTVWRATQGIG